MVIKKYREKTENIALEKAKAELGENLVVMNVKKVRPEGFLSFFKKKEVEVTVALEDDEAESMRQLRKIAIAQDKAMNKEKKAKEEKPSLSEKTIDATKAIKEAGLRTGIGPETEPGKNHLDIVVDDSRDTDTSRERTIEEKLDSLQTLLESQFSGSSLEKPETKSALRTDKNKSEAEVDAEESAESEFDCFLKLVYNTLIDNEVDERYANSIIQDAEKNRKPGATMDFLLGTVYQKLILKFGKSEGIIPSEKGPKMIFFLGPTGVGKTTTIAKIASSFAVHENKKVALLTTDTYRIAATEQLRTYAGILEVPFRVIYTASDLEGATEDFRDMDYIFVDTAGHSQKNEDLLEKQKELIDAAKEYCELQCFLVISATTKLRDLQNIVQKYKKIAQYQLIFTKLDETDYIGNLLNVSLFADCPISYVTLGQNVPDDIETFSAQKTVKQLLGGKRGD